MERCPATSAENARVTAGIAARYSVEVRTFLDILRRWWVALLIVAALAGFAGYLVADRLPVEYASTSRALVGLVDADSETIRAARDNLETYSALLTSEPALQAVVDRSELGATPADLRAKMRVRTDIATRIITITVFDPDPVAAADLANALVEQLRRLSLGAPAGSGIQVVELAQPSPIPESPGTVRSAAVAMFGGLVGTVLAIVALEFAGGRVRGRYDMEQLVPAPFLGHLTLADTSSQRPKDTVDPAAIVARALESLSPKPRSVAVPANDRDKWDASMITALALARSASENQAVALVVIGNGFGDTNEYADRPHGTPAGRRRSGPVRHGTLHIFSGPEVESISDVPDAERRLAGFAEQGFDLTIIHVQPLHISSRAVLWARAADAAIMVATTGKTRRDRLLYTVETLAQIGTPLLGSLIVDSGSSEMDMSSIEQGMSRAGDRPRGQAQKTSRPRSQPEDVAGP
jgi:succinoglycan biosynthesis transport protein ExoP